LNAAQQCLKAAQQLLNTERSEVLKNDTSREATPTSSFQLPTSNFFNRIDDSFDLAPGL
jgi:hypothetical protein